VIGTKSDLEKAIASDLIASSVHREELRIAGMNKVSKEKLTQQRQSERAKNPY
jgi:hypothetical protein